ncbi:MAG TPA: ABC transporter permease subunit [Clostridia bacterium]|nr:ABC transporter permease subunit [Clostridia bacterium]
MIGTGVRIQPLGRKLRKFMPFYVMLLLPTAYYVVFRYLPMYGLVIAFKEYDFGKGILGSPWADPLLKHYRQFFHSPYCWRILRNTLIISGYRLVFGMLPPILLAIALNECRFTALKRSVQTLTYMPHFLSWIIVYGIVLVFFSQTSGLVNKLIVRLGGRAVPFLQSNQWFRGLLVGTSVWKEMGWGAIIYLAAITSIDLCLFEAAKIDGAGRLKAIWHITLPCIRPSC